MSRNLFKEDSGFVDRHYGLNIDGIERDLLLSAKNLRPNGNMSNFGSVLHEGHQTWVGLDPQTLNTPYSELVHLCDLLSPKKHELMVDLGAGYGRLGLVLKALYPEVEFQGYELVKERVAEGNRIFDQESCMNARLFDQDLTSESFELPVAHYYFLYDYGKTEHIRKTLSQLEEIANNHHFKVVARGKGSRSIIEHEHPWLSCINDVHHEENFSIYSY